ncbi:MAG: tRNA lysidine(34) synthetase TilS [Gammaproteobacteria bacterium]|nr:tRNA lysidine(34) synthetase TilS [Gammaproteobacteria bacterium]MCY4211699.1 tRNA lysidine(34) synthetase TilS [Gammaproteobacteria bacterium]MCY4283534.1 tRNA lysidine(34) synthetase TilS [Gammaproteobacteria bacterium]MCY4337544.1 tRNA lysidine(34) synthetase TilS [Gammaproteobacteria bacterium]
MTKQPIPLSQAGIATALDARADTRHYLVAYSGGMDSHVLLWLLAGLARDAGYRVRAVHVNHNIHPHSQDWARHCRATCQALEVELTVLDVDASAPGRESPENWAREKRYGALREILAADEVLLTAHHQDDQLETLLLRLLRGAGVLGLAAMRPLREFGPGFHARPLLHYSRAQLLDYAQRHNLCWLEDPSNADTQFDRNYLRHEVLPALRHRWPALALPVSRTAQACAEAQELLDELARRDLQDCATQDPDALRVDRIQELSAPRQKNLIRHWCRVLDLPTPNSRHLAHIISDVIQARPDARPRVNWKGAELRRQRNYLYLTAS